VRSWGRVSRLFITNCLFLWGAHLGVNRCQRCDYRWSIISFVICTSPATPFYMPSPLTSMPEAEAKKAYQTLVGVPIRISLSWTPGSRRLT
jgi:hypothetical protein